ncbi:nucleotidyltransferase [Anaerosporobacter faecicola]|uniref:nucleotidyltransferase n=1 Tax=Anaerosporobacter faecicola TaxID=2718714 RepID=UPI0014387AEC|nr:nucleotidyltransferase [Anaerosporobacter faecicola]
MKIVGLITEYNPFHNGHAYHIQKSKEITGADYVVVVMSGNYVQRGTPAIIDKYTRTQMALSHGADLVFELPTLFATASAEIFAFGAIAILEGLGIIDSICFGSECGDLVLLSSIADLMVHETSEFKEILQNRLRSGLSFPIARKEALIAFAPSLGITEEQMNSVLSSSNNILGMEYLKALSRISSSIQPYTLVREGSGYHDLSIDTSYSSASALRKCLTQSTDKAPLQQHMPAAAYDILQKAIQVKAPIDENDFSDILFYQLHSQSPEKLATYLDMNVDLANRISSLSLQYHSFQGLAEAMKSKQYTRTRINRILLHILLQLHNEDLVTYAPDTNMPYARLLGFRHSSSFLLKTIHKTGRIPVITKVADAKARITTTQYDLFQKDLFATHLYNQIVYTKFHHVLPDEYRQGPVIIS